MQKLKEKIDLKENEKIISVFRHYFLIIIPNLTISFLIIILDFFLMFYFFSLGWIGVGVFLVILFIAIFYVFRLLFLWNHNFVVITNLRLIDCERSGFFTKFISEFEYRSVRSVTISAGGLWHRLLGYGDLNLEIVDQPLGFVFYNLRKPASILTLINEQINSTSSASNKSVVLPTLKYDFDEIIYHVGQLPLAQKKHLMQIIASDLEQDTKYDQSNNQS